MLTPGRSPNNALPLHTQKQCTARGSSWGLPSLSLTTEGSWGRADKPLDSPMTPVKSIATYLSLQFNGLFPGRPALAGTRMSPFWILLQLRAMQVVSGDNWSYNTCKAPVKSSPPTNQHPAFYRSDALPVTQPTVSE